MPNGFSRLKELNQPFQFFRNISANSDESWGVQHIEGVDWEPFAAMNGMTIEEGRPPTSFDEVIMDQRRMRDKKFSVGDPVELLGRNYKIVGVFFATVWRQN